MLGKPSILVLSAAYSVGKDLVQTSLDQWESVFNINVTGVYLVMSEVIPHMINIGVGSIITISFQLAVRGGRNNSAYVASKGAVISLIKSLALDYAEGLILNNSCFPPRNAVYCT